VDKYFVTYSEKARPNKKWAVKKSKNGRASKRFKTKKKAVDYGRKIAKKNKPSKLFVQKKSGRTFDNMNAYGVDSRAPI